MSNGRTILSMLATLADLGTAPRIKDCLQCKRQVSVETRTCPKCGADLTARRYAVYATDSMGKDFVQYVDAPNKDKAAAIFALEYGNTATVSDIMETYRTAGEVQT